MSENLQSLDGAQMVVVPESSVLDLEVGVEVADGQHGVACRLAGDTTASLFEAELAAGAHFAVIIESVSITISRTFVSVTVAIAVAVTIAVSVAITVAVAVTITIAVSISCEACDML
jgi:hypothetical protein